MSTEKTMTGYPSIDKPFNRFFDAVDAATGEKGLKIPEMSIYEYLYECNADNLDGDALDYFGKRITYGDFFLRIESLAKALYANGVEPGDVVSIATINSVEAYELQYACNRVGALFDFISVASDPKDYYQYFMQSSTKLVFVLDLFADRALAAAKTTGIVEKVVVMDLADEMPGAIKMGYKLKTRKQNKTFYSDPMVQKMADFRVMGQDLKIDYKKDPYTSAVYAHTGGTTGFPKGVLLTDVAYNSVAAVYRKYMPKSRGGYCLNCTVPFVVYSNGTGMHMPMSAASACQIVVPKFEPEEWPKYFKKYPNINFIVCVPSQINPWLEDPKMQDVDLSTIQVLGVGGEGCTEAFEADITKFLEAHGCKAGNLTIGYGMTEVCASACTNYPAGILDMVGVQDEIPVYHIGSVGLPHPINEFVIWDNDNNCECKYNETGEVAMYCKYTEMTEYKDEPEETAAIHKIHPDGKSYIHTGDLGHFDENGLLFITGRMKRIFLTYMIKDDNLIGFKCFPAQTEEALAKQADVSQVCCVEMVNDKFHRLKAFVAPRVDSTLSHEELENQLRAIAESELAPIQQPYIYEFRESLPTTAVGKVDFKALEAEAAEEDSHEFHPSVGEESTSEHIELKK